MEPGHPAIGPCKGVGGQFRRPVHRQLIDKELFTFFGASTVLNGVAGGVRAFEVHGHFLTETAGGIVHHQGVNAGQRRQVAWYEHRKRIEFTFVRPSIRVGIVSPFLPYHGGHRIGKHGLVQDGDLHHLGWTRCAMVVAVHRGLRDPWLDGIHGERPSDGTRIDDR